MCKKLINDDSVCQECITSHYERTEELRLKCLAVLEEAKSKLVKELNGREH